MIFVMDLDGTIYEKDRARTGVNQFLSFLKNNTYQYFFLTNTSVKDKTRISNKLLRYGINDFKENQIITSVELLKTYLSLQSKNQTMYINGGGDYLRQEILGLGNVTIVEQSDLVKHTQIDYYLQSSNQDFSFEDICTAKMVIIDKKARFLSMDNERYYINKQGELRPGTGWIVSSISFLTQKKPIIIGKPNHNLFIKLLRNMDVNPSNGFVVGDSLSSDILLGKKCGFQTCLVLNGVTSITDITKLRPNEKPDYIVTDFSELLQIVNNGG